jgi:DNA-binding NarL/FixJ family response regulator
VLSPKTVRNHVSNVLAKLNVADRSHAIVLSRQRGLGQAGD